MCRGGVLAFYLLSLTWFYLVESQQQEREELGFNEQQRAQEAERLVLLEKVRQAEDTISGRIGTLLMDNSR